MLLPNYLYKLYFAGIQVEPRTDIFKWGWQGDVFWEYIL